MTLHILVYKCPSYTASIMLLKLLEVQNPTSIVLSFRLHVSSSHKFPLIKFRDEIS
ncbi:hypothetical protein HanXRQr2_Chr02g0063671 [Helianthus annuus]|uniref:Uncharacterized protein n=1 Tax=Helianthus annuus TaxID=4232 RepID=A0A9K3P002_HELAN|nr:hypothetical protein HanXRQr2_Chr02g0063671 [Helianthus annuus]